MATPDFLSRYLSGLLPYDRRHITVNKMCWVRRSCLAEALLPAMQIEFSEGPLGVPKRLGARPWINTTLHVIIIFLYDSSVWYFKY